MLGDKMKIHFWTKRGQIFDNLICPLFVQPLNIWTNLGIEAQHWTKFGQFFDKYLTIV